MRYHLGCGEQRLEAWANVDLQATPATDLVIDLTRPRLRAAEACFSNAFFEHLRRTERLPHLQAVRAGLTGDGFVCYLGLPNFEAIARLYLEQGPGIVGSPVFDLFNVYRYTHGDPEMASDDQGYVAQMHKSLFDTAEVDRLLTDAGFGSYAIFSYGLPGEPVAAQLGFYATAEQRTTDDLQADADRFLGGFDGRFLSVNTVRFQGAVTRSPVRARLAGSPVRRAARRVIRGVTTYLMRV